MQKMKVKVTMDKKSPICVIIFRENMSAISKYIRSMTTFGYTNGEENLEKKNIYRRS